MNPKSPSFFRLFRSRAGIELAVNTLVVMILGIMVVGGGIYFLGIIMSGGESLPTKLTSDQQNELNSMMTRGQLVAVSPLTKSSPGAKPVSFGVGIDNRLSQDTEFTIEVSQVANWTITTIPTLKVAANKRATALVVVGSAKGKEVPKGTYTFIVTVKAAGVVYDSPRYFTVVVD